MRLILYLLIQSGFNYELTNQEDSGSSIGVICKTFIVVMMIICLCGLVTSVEGVR